MQDVKIFSSYFERFRKEKKFVSFFNKKVDQQNIWIMASLPFNNENTKVVFNQLCSLIVYETFEGKESVEINFENSLKNANSLLEENFANLKSDILENGSIILSMYEDGNLLISVFGKEAEVLLYRDNDVNKISENITSKNVNEDFFQNISSGEIKDGDKVLFSTTNLSLVKNIGLCLKDGVHEAKECISEKIDVSKEYNLFVLGFRKISNPVLLNIEDKKYNLDFLNKYLRLIKKNKNLRNYLNKVNKKHVVGVLVFLLVIFLYSAFSGKDDAIQQVGSNEYQEFIDGVNQNFSQIDKLLINKKNNEANIKLNKMQETAEKMIIERVDINNASQIIEMIDKKRQEVNNIMVINNPKIFSDLSVLDENIKTNGFFTMNKEIFIFDNDTLYKAFTSNDKPEKFGIITSSDNVKLGSSFKKQGSVLFFTETNNLLELKNNQVVSMDTADSQWKNADDIDTYDKFVYFLDKKNNQIWKYERRVSGFTKSAPWLKEEYDLSNIISFTIDGSIYALDKQEGIVKFYRGKKISYTVEGLPEEKVIGDVIYTDENSSYIFVLNKSKNIITILNKGENSATYNRQIVLENTENIKNISTYNSQIFLLGDKKVYSISL